MWSSRPYTFDRVVRIFFTAVVACIILYFLYSLKGVLLPFFVACLIAYMIEPWVKWNMRVMHVNKHAWAVVITVLEAFLAFAAFCLVLIPLIEREFSELGVFLSHYMKEDNSALGHIPASIHSFLHSHFNVDRIVAEMERVNVSQIGERLWDGLTNGLRHILGILGWLIVIVYVIFILLDFDKYMGGVKQLIPDRYMGPVKEVAHDVSWTMRQYFRHQALISFITGICYIIGFSIVGIPMAVVIGLICMVLFMVPYLVYLSVIPVVVMCVFKSMETGVDFWVILAECAAVYVFVETFSDLFLTPRIMGKALGLNPAIILLALSVWGSLLGLLGMVIALPASTIIIKWTKLWLTSWRNKVNAATPPTSTVAAPPEPEDAPS